MPAIRGLTVAVGEWYARTLAICLPRNMKHLTECLVITTPRDEMVKEVCRDIPGVRLYETDDFTAYGAHFNKGLCVERGFDVLGRHGWLAIWDSDCLWPDELPLGSLQPTRLYGARRRILDDPSKWRPDLNWRECPYARDGGPIGHTQIFNCCDPAIRDKRPWYDVSFAHGGGGDAAFMEHWPNSRRTVLPIDVLHLGPVDRNWFGVTPEARRIMDAFVIRNGWARSAMGRDRAAAEQVGEIVERVEVPGYAKSTYELPFVRRAKARRAAAGGSP